MLAAGMSWFQCCGIFGIRQNNDRKAPFLTDLRKFQRDGIVAGIGNADHSVVWFKAVVINDLLSIACLLYTSRCV